MLGIFLIYFIGKKFYELADRYHQSKWLFAILSVVVYYAGGFMFGVVLALLDFYVFEWNLDWDDATGINLLSVPVGVLTVYGFYKLLENRWKENVVLVKDEIQDIGKDQDN